MEQKNLEINKEKQIEEMANIIDKYGRGLVDYECRELAENLYDAGYCEQSEVARKIFAEIDDAIDNLRGAFLRQKISEIKKEFDI